MPQQIDVALEAFGPERVRRAHALLDRFLVKLACATTANEPALPAPMTNPSAALTQPYVVGSCFLYDCQRYLSQGEPEWMHYVSGLRVGEVRTLDKVVSFALATQTTGYV